MFLDGFNALLRAVVAGLAGILDPIHPLLGLSVASVLIGMGMLWVVGRTSNQAAIERAKKRMQAHLLEMRVYRDEPAVLVRAQAQLLASNARYLGHMLRPAAVLSLPMIVLFGHFDAVYGRRPLQVGESALISARTSLSGQELSLTVPAGFEVTADSVTVNASGEVVWRIQATSEGDDEATLHSSGGKIGKRLVASAAAQYVSATRTGTWWERLLLAPGESGFSAGAVSAVTVDYPSREVGLGGLSTHWVIWFLGISILTAYMLKNRFGIVL